MVFTFNLEGEPLIQMDYINVFLMHDHIKIRVKLSNIYLYFPEPRSLPFK